VEAGAPGCAPCSPKSRFHRRRVGGGHLVPESRLAWKSCPHRRRVGGGRSARVCAV